MKLTPLGGTKTLNLTEYKVLETRLPVKKIFNCYVILYKLVFVSWKFVLLFITLLSAFPQSLTLFIRRLVLYSSR